MKKGFKVFSHTADIGLQIQGRHLAELFEHAAEGMMCILSDPQQFIPQKKVSFVLQSSNWESLLVDWLSEILYYFSVKKIGFSKFKVHFDLRDFKLKGQAQGEYFDLTRHKIFREVKAVTYHDLKIRKLKNGYSTRIIFDI